MMEEKLRQLGKQLDDLAEKGKTVKNDVKAEFNRMLTDLEYIKEEIAGKLKEMKNAGGDALEKLKKKNGELMDKLEKGIKEFPSFFWGAGEDAVRKLKEYQRKQKDDYLKELSTKLEGFEERNILIKSRMVTIGTDSIAAYEEGLKILERKHGNLMESMENLKSKEGKDFDDLKSDVDIMIEDIERTYDEIHLPAGVK